MKAEHKIWWEALADQYEEWAAEPPMFGTTQSELYTCSAFYNDHDHWGFLGRNRFEEALHDIIRVAGYVSLMYPIGNIYDTDRGIKREAFCQDMADTIRENIK